MKRTIAVYPGRFNIFTPGHLESYKELVSVFGAENTFIMTRDGLTSDNLFTYNEKRAMMLAAGVSRESTVKLDEGWVVGDVVYRKPDTPFRPWNFLSHCFDLQNTVVVYGISQKDLQPGSRFAKTTNRNGTPSYYQPYNAQTATPMTDGEEHAYVYGMKTYSFDLPPCITGAKSASEVRDFIKHNPFMLDVIVSRLYSQNQTEIFEILKNRLLLNTP